MKNSIYVLVNSLEAGGGERQVVNLCNNLCRDYNVFLITLKKDKFYEVDGRIQHIYLSNIKYNFLMFFLIPFYVIKFKRILKTYNLKIGMSSLEISNFVNILSTKNSIINLVINIGFFKGFFGLIYRILIKILYPKAKKIIVNSEENRFSIAKYLGIPLSKVYTVYNPIDYELIETLKKEKIPQNIIRKVRGKKIFLTVGRLVWQKRHCRIISALGRVYNEKDKNFVYLIIGDGPEKENLERQIGELNLENNVLFLGTQENVFKYMSIANYFLYASDYEGMPNVFVEAMACKLPIITTNFETGAQEIVFGEYTEKNVVYPVFGENGLMLDTERYEEQFLEIYDELGNIRVQQKGLDKFLVGNVMRETIKVLF